MLYSPEPKALASFDQAFRFSPHFPGFSTNQASGDRTLNVASRTCLTAQKANTISMSRGFNFVSEIADLLRITALKLPRHIVVCSLFLICLGGAVPTAHAQSAAAWSKRGADAEVREDYDAAYEAYKQAHTKSPKDLRYKAHFERMRFLAGTQHIDRGRILRQSGDYTGAITQFMRAAEIDPSNQAAQQEIERTQRDQPPPQLTGAAAVAMHEQMSQQKATLESINSIAGPIELKPVSNEPITLHMVEDVKVIYQAIGKVAGLNVLFDPDYTSKRIPVDLTNVSLSEALRIVGTIAGTFYKPVTANTIFVAQNTRTKRTDLDELAVQTFYLSNSSQPNDGNEILTGLRLLLDPTVKLYLVPSQNAIVMRATTDQLLLAQKLINDFDRARPEVVVDVAVLEVNRDKIRNLGITLPTSFGIAPQIPTTSTTSTSTTTSSTTSSSLTLNNLAHLNATDFAVTVSGGTVNALLSDTDTRVLQNPRIRATDGQRATLKIGQKIPVATGSYNAGVSTGVASIGVQTQFTYLDVGVNIDITPSVHYDREVSLKTKVEVSQQNGSVTISGVTEPIIAQRVLEQVIQLKDGEPSILAGIVTKQDNKSVSGTPGLGELPFFKFFFSTQNKEVQQDEIVFLLIPHIVRESVLTRLNTAVIDTGTGASIELRRDETVKPMSTVDMSESSIDHPLTQSNAAQAASAAVQQMRQQSAPPTPPSTPPAGQPLVATPVPAANMAPSGAAFGSGVMVSVLPATSSQAVGSTFQVNVNLSGGEDIYSVPMQLQFDPHVLQLVNVDAGDLLKRDGKEATVAHRLDDNGMLTIAATRPPGAKGVTGQGTVCTLTFKAETPGETNISFVRVGAKNSAQMAIAAGSNTATIHVK